MKEEFIAKGVGAGLVSAQKEKGITLIALVITVIVLLILAGVTIAMVVGDNGILTRAREAKSATEIAEENEKRELARAEAAMNMENTTYEGVTIPAGFAPTRIDGENKVEDGLVITDSEGNEFVWIPCTLEEYKEAKDMLVDEEKDWSYDDGYKINGGTESKDWHNNYTDEDNGKITYISENLKNNWERNQSDVAENSIKKFNGFFVARYEAGIPKNDIGFYVSPDEKEQSELKYNRDRRGTNDDTDKIRSLSPVSKKGVQAWNFITQPNAKLVAENMYKGNNSVGSYLIDSQAWNHICDKKLKKKDIKNSVSWGNYLNNTTTDYNQIEGLWAHHEFNSGWKYASNYNTGRVNIKTGGTNRIELGTGLSEDFKNYNIYDMAGNMWEWTTEHNISNDIMYVVSRGRQFR